MLSKRMVVQCLLGSKDRETPYRYIHDELLKVLRKHDGKKPTKRIANDLQKEHPSWTVVWSTDYGMYVVKVWGGNSGLDYKNMYSGLVAYRSADADRHPGGGNVVDSETFDREYDTSAGEASRMRAEKVMTVCQDDGIVNEVYQVALMVKACQDAKQAILKRIDDKHGYSVSGELDKLIGSVD